MSTAPPLAPSGSPDITAPEFSWRVLRLLNVFRMLVAILLLALFLYPETPHLIGQARPELFFATTLSAFVFAAINDFAVTQRWPSVSAQVVIQAAVDIIVISLLVHATGFSAGLGNLLVVTIGALGLISSRQRALTLASAAALAMLAQQYLLVIGGEATLDSMMPAGILGAILMFIGLAVNPLARRIQENEALARQRSVDLENLAQLNQYIIQNLRESIIVVDGDDRIRLMNQAAATYLGTDATRRGLHLKDVSPYLAEYAAVWRREGTSDTPPAFAAADGSTMINPYFAPIGRPRSGAILIFLEDVSVVAEKVQQTKLAALGRLSASIAHEIRNPVGAVSHAGQLLAESDRMGESEQKLAGIVVANAKRVGKIVDNVLQLSRRETTHPERLDLPAWLEQFRSEFSATMQFPETAIVIDNADPDLEVRMDRDHLHQVMWNLCENAVRYGMPEAPGDGEAGGATIAIMIELVSGRRAGTGRPFLEVRDRGPGVAPESAERIFEPFFRGRSGDGGSGLGLFICRELCGSNGAALLYEPRDGGGSIFRIIFADPRRWET